METNDRSERTEINREAVYETACAKMRGIRNAGMQREAIELFKTIPGFRDADERIAVCEQRIRDLEEQEKTERIVTEHTAKKRKTAIVAVLSALAFCAVSAVLLFTVILPAIRYDKADALRRAGEYEAAITAFEAMDGYRDSSDRILECRYGMATDFFAAGDYEAAMAAFAELDGYADSAAQIEACSAAITERSYAEALALYEAKNAEEAYPMLIALDGYKDSAKLASEIYDAYKAARLLHAEVGEYLLFGAYEQDNDPSNGKEDIEWQVLAKDENGLLVISRYALDYMQYSSSTENASWETCSLRKWLNDTFLNSAFDADEQSRIRDVIGKVFLLSTPDAYKYMSTDEDRKCAPTEYAIAKGAITSSSHQADGRDTCGWWLRTPYSSNYHAAVISPEGSVSTLDVDIWLIYYGVRPALWIETNG